MLSWILVILGLVVGLVGNELAHGSTKIPSWRWIFGRAMELSGGLLVMINVVFILVDFGILTPGASDSLPALSFGFVLTDLYKLIQEIRGRR